MTTEPMAESHFFRIGDRALLIKYGERIDPECNRTVRTMAALCRSEAIPGVVEVSPAYCSFQLIYDPFQTDPGRLEASIRSLEHRLDASQTPPSRTVAIPVCYGHEFGPDLSVVAEHNGLSVREVIDLHSRREYLIYMLGFTPGFPYLGGLDSRLHTPRRETPRTEVAAGSVGIAQGQTGIYPVGSPGGWRLIGRTPLKLFNPEKKQATRYHPGDSLVFKPISIEEYHQLKEEENHG